jgi:hypothetical protein
VRLQLANVVGALQAQATVSWDAVIRGSSSSVGISLRLTFLCVRDN